MHFILQAEQRGTGHALQTVKAHFELTVKLSPRTWLVLSGDVPLFALRPLRSLAAFHQREHAAMTILTAKPPDPTGYGRVIRASAESPEVTAIVEQKALSEVQKNAPEINSGIYCSQPSTLREARSAIHEQRAWRVLPYRHRGLVGR